MRILAIINSYNLSSFPSFLKNNIDGWLKQDLPSDCVLDIVLSDVVSSDGVREEIRQYAKANSKPNKNFTIICHNTNVPVYISFNLCIKHFNTLNKYDYFIYSSEDCVMTLENDLTNILSDFKYSPNVGQVTGLVNLDNTIFYKHYDAHKKNAQPFKIQLSESINMHFSVWSYEFMSKYDFKYVDVLTAYATESLYTFLHAAVGTEWVHCRKVLLSHQRSKKPKGYLGYEVFKQYRSIESIFKPGMDVGLGFECWMASLRSEKRKHWYPIKKGVYSKRGVCKKPDRLHEYIKNNLFIPKDVFDYDSELNNIKVIKAGDH